MGLKAAILALKPLGERLMRMAGIETPGSIVKGAEKAFPGIFSMSREEFVGALKQGRFATEFADDMGGYTARKELSNIETYLRKGGKFKEGMQEVMLPGTEMMYETHAVGYVRGGKVIAGGYSYKKGANYDWVRAGLYTSPAVPKAVDKYSIPKVISAMMMKRGGLAPKSLSTPGAKSYWDVVHSIRANMKHTTKQVKGNTNSMTVPGQAMNPRRGGSRQGPQGGT
jgi:hypothetical protein